ncbi:ABC transporter permease [Cephaloticoccus primus]|uniref:ABC transporter permease n=1 Tax=Cephaloticoccus primus TaxID=1548207 RepID=A0A139SIZ2_9BACT|nr:branched-chain amino acid ABC transporter permease [Cephaloticoccus primus]KXU34506.1 ABC transporter permease [Cephaloticoccus primus]
MEAFFQQLLNGLSLGAIYALIALGYTMVYGVLRFINFAHADVFMSGAFIGYYAAQRLPPGTVWGGLAVLGAAMLGCALIGMLIERLAYRPLRGAPTLNVLITAIGVSLLMEYSGQLFFGATPRTFPAVFPTKQFSLGGLAISSNQLLVIAAALALVAALQLIIHRTRIGTAMRAVAQNPRAAQLMGVNNSRVIAFTFGLGSALAGAGGILYALNYPSIDPLMGVSPGLKAFTAAILGGIGNIPGAALGGLLLGTVETFVSGSALSTYKDAIAFTILLTILFFRPAGLLGRATAEKV